MTNKVTLNLTLDEATLTRRAIEAYGADLGSKWGKAKQPSTRERLLNECTLLHVITRRINQTLDGEENGQ